MRRDNFYCYRNILAIDPGYSVKNGTGYAIFDHETHRLKRCGLIQPFAPGLESHASTIEIAQKVRLVWEEEVGFSYDPEILCIENPRACFTRQGVRVNSNSIIMLAVLCTRIEGKFFSAKSILRPYPKRITKDQTRQIVIDKLDAWSKKILERDLASIAPFLHHNVYDAVGWGLWVIDEKNRVSKPKKNGLKLGSSER